MLRKGFTWTGYILFLFIVTEAAARIALSSSGLLDHIALNNDPIWRLRWVLQTRSQADDIYTSIDDHHPRRGWTLKPGLRDVEIKQQDRTWKVNTNSQGLRGTAEYAVRKRTTRIAVYGDSFTFGEEVNDDQTYAYQLQQQLFPDSEVLNFGIHGYGHDQIYLYMQETLDNYDPDIVILGYIRDDARRNMRQFRGFAKPKFVADDQSTNGLKLLGTPVPTRAAVFEREVYRPKILDVVEILHAQYAEWTGEAAADLERVTLRLLSAMQKLVEDRNGIFLLVYLPHSEDLLFPNEAWIGRQVYERFCERSSRCLDLRDELAYRRFKGEPIKAPGHWHANGHRLVAELVARHLKGGVLKRRDHT